MVADAVAFARGLADGLFGRAGLHALRLMRAAKRPSRETIPGTLKAPWDWAPARPSRGSRQRARQAGVAPARTASSPANTRSSRLAREPPSRRCFIPRGSHRATTQRYGGATRTREAVFAAVRHYVQHL